MMKSLFIEGTDTGVGKTMVTGLLARSLYKKGHRVVTQKWVQTGSRFPDDIIMHRRIMGYKTVLPEMPLRRTVCPYCLPYPSSPHLAARRAHMSVSPARIKNAFGVLAARYDTVLVEGTGGIHVPLTRNCLSIDIVTQLGLPVLIVADNRLGAINHTLLTVEAVRSRNLTLAGVVYVSTGKECPGQIRHDNPHIITALGKVPFLGRIPYRRDYRRLFGVCESLAKKIISRVEHR